MIAGLSPKSSQSKRVKEKRQLLWEVMIRKQLIYGYVQVVIKVEEYAAD